MYGANTNEICGLHISKIFGHERLGVAYSQFT